MEFLDTIKRTSREDFGADGSATQAIGTFAGVMMGTGFGIPLGAVELAIRSATGAPQDGEWVMEKFINLCGHVGKHAARPVQSAIVKGLLSAWFH